MAETIRIGGLELRFFQTKEDTGGSLDLFEMIVQPNARVPVPHYHESWDETVYGLTGALTWRIDGQEGGDPARSLYIAWNGWTADLTATVPAPGGGKWG